MVWRTIITSKKYCIQMIEEYILKKLKNEVDDVIVMSGESNSSHIKFVNNKIAKTGTEILKNISIFAVWKKRVMFTSLKDFDQNTIDKTINNLLKFIKSLQPKEDYYGIAKGPFKYKDIPGLYDKSLIHVNQIDLVEKAINAADVKRCSGDLILSESNSRLIGSNNVDTSTNETNAHFSIRCFMDKEATGHQVISSPTLKNFDVEKTARVAGEIAKMARNPIETVSGKYDVVFHPMAGAALLETIGSSASAFNVSSKMSFLENKIGKKLGNFTLVDNPTIPGGIGSMKHDSEGVPTNKTTIIDKGTLKTYLHNTSTAKKFKTKTTANAGLITPEFFNLVLEPGKNSFKNILPDKGIYITNVWYTRFNNYSTGDFSTIPRDGIFLIKNGEISQPIKNIRVSDNMLNIMKNMSQIANDSQQILSWEVGSPVTTPSFLVKNVNITKPTN